MDLIPVTDLKQWAYCRRIVYYHRVMPGVGRPTYKMAEAVAAQEMIERLEVRRGLAEYGFADARRRFGLWLTDEQIGLSGKIDLLLDRGGDAAVVDFKLTSGEVADNHRLQLSAYAVLVEAAMNLRVNVGFLFRIPDNRIFPVSITSELRERVAAAVGDIRRIADLQWLPQPTPVRARCQDCEYANYCADVW